MREPKFYFLAGRHSHEIPAEVMERTGRWGEPFMNPASARAKAHEIAPGVHAVFIGWTSSPFGGTIAVWDDR